MQATDVSPISHIYQDVDAGGKRFYVVEMAKLLKPSWTFTDYDNSDIFFAKYNNAVSSYQAPLFSKLLVAVNKLSGIHYTALRLKPEVTSETIYHHNIPRYFKDRTDKRSVSYAGCLNSITCVENISTPGELQMTLKFQALLAFNATIIDLGTHNILYANCGFTYTST